MSYVQNGKLYPGVKLLTTPLALATSTFPTLDRYTGLPLPNCSRPINYGVKASTLVMEFDSGHQQRRQKATPKTTIDLQYTALTLTEYQTLRDFFMLVLNVTPFSWTDPIEKTTYQVTFNQDTFMGIQKGHGPTGPWYEVQLKLVQCWG